MAVAQATWWPFRPPMERTDRSASGHSTQILIYMYSAEPIFGRGHMRRYRCVHTDALCAHCAAAAAPTSYRVLFTSVVRSVRWTWGRRKRHGPTTPWAVPRMFNHFKHYIHTSAASHLLHTDGHVRVTVTTNGITQRLHATQPLRLETTRSTQTRGETARGVGPPLGGFGE